MMSSFVRLLHLMVMHQINTFSHENFPKSADEKLQQNRFLTEVLDMILTSGFYEK